MVSTTTKAAPKKRVRKAKTTKSQSAESAPVASKSAKPKSPSRDVIYPEIEFQRAKSLNAEKAKALLGWREETDNLKVTPDQLMLTVSRPTEDGEKPVRVTCMNNRTNRPIYPSNYLTLKQEILRGNWEFNAEPIIIGETGQVLNGQHTLIALILAAEEYERSAGKWAHVWQSSPTIDKLVVFGVSEHDDVVNTLDTPKPRSLSDVMYRSEYFREVAPTDRAKLARVTDYCVRTLWQRTGCTSDSSAPRLTHREALRFIERHPSVLPAVKHVFEEDGSGKITKVIGPGYAAALLYLMAASDTPEDTKYGFTDSSPCEEMLDMSRWDKACDFWTCVAAGDTTLDELRRAIASLIEDEVGASVAARTALVIKAWELWKDDEKITTADLALRYEQADPESAPVLVELPVLTGIDLGTSK